MTEIGKLLGRGKICESDMRVLKVPGFRISGSFRGRIRTGDRHKIKTLACKEQRGYVLFFDMFHGYLGSTLVNLGTSRLCTRRNCGS